MNQQFLDEERVRHYLLGELSEQERRTVEERLLTDDEYFKHLLVLEDELTDEYVGGALSEQETAEFEKHFLSLPEQRQNVGFARALKRYVSTAEVLGPSGLASDIRPPGVRRQSLIAFLRIRNQALGFSLAAALLLVALAGLWLLIRGTRQQDQLEQSSSGQTVPQGEGQVLQPAPQRTPGDTPAEGLQQEKNQSARLGQEAAPGKVEQKGEGLPPPAPSPAVVALVLRPGLMRDSGEIKRLIIPPEAHLVQLRLDLSEDNYKNYRAVIMTAEGVAVWSSNRLNAKSTNYGKSIVLRLAAGRFAKDDYLVKLSGVNVEGNAEDVNTYYFRVLKK